MKKITKYRFGCPFDTMAVVVDVPESGEKLPYFRIKQKGGLIFTCDLAAEDMVYGLGETMRGINKRGGSYTMYNTDAPNHHDGMKSLYGTHNFVIVDGSRRTEKEDGPLVFGAFFDTPSRIRFEVDDQGSNKLKVFCENPDLRLYLIEDQTPYGVVKQFLSMIGRSFLPPLWAFGYGQSRWGYKCEKDFAEVADRYRKAGIPLDYICMDIDYMDHFIDFTVNKKRFPDLKAFSDRLKQQGVRLVPIIDAGIKTEPGNPVYDEGVEKGYFCTNEEGKPFQAAVWPGMTHFPDFFRPEVRDWFGSQYGFLTRMGIEGFWNDMNEPAIFYSEYSRQKSPVDMALNALLPSRKETTGGGYSNAYSDYHCFYHEIDGKKVVHHDVHNEFGARMTQAAGEGLAKLMDHRYLLFVRSSCIGAHRYGGIWTGDNSSKWELLRTNVRQMPSLNMCGFLYSGADTGGFSGNCTRELLLRWLAFSVFTPLMRNHTMLATRPQECYRYSGVEDFRSIIRFRYYLLPYLYSEFMKAALRQDMLIKPLAFEYPRDDRCREVEDQLLIGESIMIAPVLEKGATGRKVYLPEPMMEVRYCDKELTGKTAPFSCREVPAGEREISVDLSEIVFYIRSGHLVPVAEKVGCTSEMDLENVRLLGNGKRYEQYIDNGQTREVGLDLNIRLLTLE